MKILAIEPYYGGSHRQFLDGLTMRSRHEWTLLTLPPRHWKWRMRSAPLALSEQLAELPNQCKHPPDVILCSDMLDLPTWQGLTSRQHPWVAECPVVTYFHENQWDYPTAPGARADHHFAYTNLLTAVASDECWFNSQYNRHSFLSGCRDFLKRMPDCRVEHRLDSLEPKSHVIAPGFNVATEPNLAEESFADRPTRLGWVSRFEHDKRPDRFLALLQQLQSTGFEFELILLGERGRHCESLDEIVTSFPSQILHNGFAKSRGDYEQLLQKMDFVISTADHEFFGIAICEAIWCGAIPITPNGLSYTEYVPDALRFDTTDQAAEIIRHFHPKTRGSLQRTCRQNIEGFRMEQIVPTIDARLETLATAKPASAP